MLRNLTTSTRLLLLAITAVAGIGLIGLLGIFEISGMGRELHQDLNAARVENSAMLEVKTTQAAFLLQVKAFKDVLLRGSNEESYEKHLKEFKERQADVTTHLDGAIGWMKQAGVPTDDAEALKTAHAELSAKYLDALGSFEKGDPEAGKKSDKQVRGIDRPTNEKLNKLVADMEKRSAEQTSARLEASEQSASRTRWVFSIIVLVGFVAMAYMSVLIHHQLMAQLGGDPAYAAKIVAGIAEGNLTQTIELKAGDDKSLLASMQRMQSGLRRVIDEISRAAENMGDSSKQLAATAQQVAAGAHQQSESSASMAASIEQLSSSITLVADSSGSAHSLSDQARQHSKDGAEHIVRTIESINGAAKSMEGAMEAVYRLGEQSAAISGILDAIREIADQTNLLALNAAIEAARAGEQGRGFAVVADEVRKLAEKTGTSTREIADMIAAVQQGVQATVRQMEEGSAEVRLGITAAAETGKAMQAIEASANQVLAAVDDISVALHEQSGSANEVSRNVEATAQLAEENGAAVEEVSSATAYLDELAQKLRQSIHHFHT